MRTNTDRRKKKIEKVKRDLTLDKFYSEATVKEMMATITSIKERRPHHYFYIMLVIYTGARRNEVLDIRVDALVGGYVTIDAAKGSKDRSIPLPSDFYSDVLLFGQGREYLFSGIYEMHPDTCSRMIRKYLKPSIKVKRPLGALRHYMGIRLYRLTKDVKVVASVLGHRYIKNSDIYIDICETEIVRELFP